MKKLISIFTIILMSISVLSGCATQAPAPAPAPASAAPAPEAPAPEAPAPAEQPATTGGIVTVYSPHPAETINIGVKEFQERTGITVDIVAAGTGELLKRIEAESANPMGDVMWGGGAESLQANAALFEPYASPQLANIPAGSYAADNIWTGESPLPMVIMYNKDLVPEDSVPKGWADILKEEFKGKIAMADPAKSGSAYTILATMITAFGKDDGGGWDFIRQFYANLDEKVLGASGDVYKGVSDGEYSIGLTLEKEAIKYVNAGAPVGIVYPDEGTSAAPDGICLIKNAKNSENAKLFIDFVLSQEIQELYVKEISRRGSRTDISSPEGLPAMQDIKLVDYDFDWAANDKNAVLEQWKDIVIGK